MKTLLYPLLHKISLCMGIILTIWGCDNFPQKSEKKSGIAAVEVRLLQKEVDSLDDMAWELSTQNPDSALKLTEKAMKLAVKIDYKIGLAKAFNAIGWTKHNQGKYKEALQFYLQALTIYEKIGEPE